MYFQSSPSPLFITLNRIQECLQLNDTNFADLLEVTESEWIRIKSGTKDAGLEAVVHLSEQFELSLEALSQGDIDYLALSRNFMNDGCLDLPEKYQTLKTSRAHTALNFLSFIEEARGPLAGLRILKRLQIHPKFFSHPDSAISPTLLTDLLKEFAKTGVTLQLLKEIGRRSYITNKTTAIGLTFSKERNSHDLVHSIVYDHPALFDQNHFYRIEDFSQ